ncbi:MAG: tetratricopeptide repeat protein, partial [Burkholderiales bacterium]
GLLAGTALAYAAHDRLVAFSSPLRLWEDAAAKLPEKPVPWGSRALYHLGYELLHAGQPEKAIAATERCALLYPRTVHCVYARGAIHLHLGQYGLAREYLLRAIELKPGEGYLYHRLGLALEGLAQIDQARIAYRRAQALGYGGGRYELERLDRGERRWK